MADLSITAANVGVSGSTAKVRIVQVGEAVEQGEVGYLDTATSKYKLADASAEATAVVAGVFLTPAAADGYAVMATSGGIDLGVTLTVAATLVLSDTAGKIMPIADLTSGEYSSTLGICTAADTLELKIDNSGVVVPT